MMSQRPELRGKLESAIRAQQAAVAAQQLSTPANASSATASAPSIKLKTDFSNFK